MQHERVLLLVFPEPLLVIGTLDRPQRRPAARLREQVHAALLLLLRGKRGPARRLCRRLAREELLLEPPHLLGPLVRHPRFLPQCGQLPRRDADRAHPSGRGLGGAGCCREGSPCRGRPPLSNKGKKFGSLGKSLVRWITAVVSGG